MKRLVGLARPDEANVSRPVSSFATIPLLALARVALLVALVAAFLMSCRQHDEGTEDVGNVDPQGLEAPTEEPSELIAVTLYFPGEGGGLYAETHRIPMQENVETQVTLLLETLLAGPEGGGLRSPMPEGVTLRRCYVQEDGTAIVDLTSPEGTPPPASGSHEEMLRVWSVVNSVTLNIPEIHALLLLWNGEQPLTFAGHLDLARPLTANRTLVVAES